MTPDAIKHELVCNLFDQAKDKEFLTDALVLGTNDVGSLRIFHTYGDEVSLRSLAFKLMGLAIRLLFRRS